MKPVSFVQMLAAVSIMAGTSAWTLCAQAPPAASPDNPDLARYDAFYEREVREKVDPAYQVSLRKLNEAYRASVEAAVKRIASQGLLDEAVAVKNEGKRFAESNSVPGTDDPGTNAEVVKLRASWRVEAARLDRQRMEALKPLIDAQIVRLRTLEKELTRALKLDQAKEVRTRTESLAAQITPQNATPPGPVAGIRAATPASAATPRPMGLTQAPPGTPKLNWLGKTVRIRTFKDRAEGLQMGEDDPLVAPLQGAAPGDSTFKVSKGTQPGTVTFEPVSKRGFYLRHEGYKLHLTKGVIGDSLFFIEKPLEGTEGVSIAAQNHPRHHMMVNDRGKIDLSEDIKEPPRAIFIFEEVVGK